MKIIERRPIPIYEVVCDECKSRIVYKKSEVHNSHITCPVCGVSMWADTTMPVRMEDADNDYEELAKMFGDG